MEDVADRKAVLCILDFLRTARCPEGADPEAVGIAIDCLSTAYSLDATNDADLSRYGVQPGLLRRLLESGAQGQAPPPGNGGKREGVQGDERAPGAGSAAEETRRDDGEVSEGVTDISIGEDQGAGQGEQNRLSGGAADTSTPADASNGAPSEDGAKESARVEPPEPKLSSLEESQDPTSRAVAASAVASGVAGSAVAAGSGSGSAVDVAAKLEEFLKGLESANYYDGTTPGSWEYLERQRQAKKIFDHCIEQQRRQQEEQQGQGPGATTGSAAAPSSSEAGGSQPKGKQPAQESSDAPSLDQQSLDKKAEADRLKTEGNTAMSEKRYAEAAALYTQAITLHENSAIFWANRAAAHLQLGNYEEALSDSQESIQRDPTYSKAYSRLGHAYMGLQKYKEAIDLGFKKALELDSSNNSIKESMKAAKRKLDARRGEEAREQEQRERNQQQQQHHGQGSSFGFSFPSGGIPGFPPQGSGGNMFPQAGFGTPLFGPQPSQQGNVQMPGVNLEYAMNEGRPGGRLVIQSTDGNPLDVNHVNSLLGMFRPASSTAGQQSRRPC